MTRICFALLNTLPALGASQVDYKPDSCQVKSELWCLVCAKNTAELQGFFLFFLFNMQTHVTEEGGATICSCLVRRHLDRFMEDDASGRHIRL